MREALDVAACLRLLKRRVRHHDFCPLLVWRGNHCACGATKLNEMHRALASALPGMGKDSERLDALESWTKGDQTICPPGNHGGENTHWLLARDDDAKGDRYGIWSETTEGPTLREAIDAARAAQPEETSADASQDCYACGHDRAQHLNESDELDDCLDCHCSEFMQSPAPSPERPE